MARGHLLCAVADDAAAPDVVDTGRALAHAAGLAPVFANVAEVEIAASSSIIPAGAGFGWAPFPEGGFYAAERRAAEHSAGVLTGLGIDEGDAHVATGNPTAELHDYAREIDAVGIVTGGALRHRFGAYVMGSVPRWLAVNGSCPVVFARPTPPLEDGGPVVCGVDPAAESARRVAGVAARFAVLMDRPLVLVHVGRFGPAEELGVLGYEQRLDSDRRSALGQLENIARDLPAGLDTEVVLEEGWEAERLRAQADSRSAALIVVGNRGRGPIRSTLTGSVSLELASSAPQIVVIVPPNAERPTAQEGI